MNPSNTICVSQEGPANALALNKDSTQVVIAGRNVFKVFSIGENEFTEVCNLRVGKNLNLNFSSIDVAWNIIEENTIATAATNGAVVVWNLGRSGRSKQEHVFSDHKRTVNKVSFHLTEPSLLISGSQDGMMKCFDLRMKEVARTFISNTESIRDVQFSPHSANTFAAVSENGNVQLWDVRRHERCLQQFTAHSGPVFACDWHPDLPWLATASRDKTIKVWDIHAKPTLEHTIYTIASVGHVKWRPQKKHQLASCALVLDSSVHVWDVRRPHVPLATFSEHRDVTTAIAWQAGPDAFLSTSRDCSLYRHRFTEAAHPVLWANPQGVCISARGDIAHATPDCPLPALPAQSPAPERTVPGLGRKQPTAGSLSASAQAQLEKAFPGGASSSLHRYTVKAQPSTSQPSTSQPSTSQPSSSRPSTSQPSTSQPSTSQPSTSQPSQPSTSRPSTSRPSTSQPSTSQPSTSQPSSSRPSTSQPSSSQQRPAQPNPAQPNPAQPNPAQLNPVLACAKEYKMRGLPPHELADHNAKVARSHDRNLTAHVWSIIAFEYSYRAKLAAAGAPPPPPQRPARPDPPPPAPSYSSAVEEEPIEEIEEWAENQFHLSGVLGMPTHSIYIPPSKYAKQRGDGDENAGWVSAASAHYVDEDAMDWTLPEEAFPLRAAPAPTEPQPRANVGHMAGPGVPGPSGIQDEQDNSNTGATSSSPSSGSSGSGSSAAPTNQSPQLNRQHSFNQQSSTGSTGTEGAFGRLTVRGGAEKVRFDLAPMLAASLKYHANLGDVQTAAVVMIVLQEHRKDLFPYIEEGLQEQWLLGYIELLQRHKLYNVATEVVRCAWLGGVWGLSQQSTSISVICGKCGRRTRPHQPCERCVPRHVPDVCAVCHEIVRGLYAWCQGCSHGGHLHHMKSWMEKNTLCPAGCGHQCELG